MLNRNVINCNRILRLVQFKDCLPRSRNPWSYRVAMTTRILNMLPHYFITLFRHLEARVAISSWIPAEEIKLLLILIGLMEGNPIHVFAEWMVDRTGKVRDAH